jgi:hypothetical protein
MLVTIPVPYALRSGISYMGVNTMNTKLEYQVVQVSTNKVIAYAMNFGVASDLVFSLCSMYGHLRVELNPNRNN